MRIRALFLVILALSAGCVGDTDRERSIETFEIPISTPHSETETPSPERRVVFLGLENGSSSLAVGPGGSALLVDTGEDPNATEVLTALNDSDVDDYDLWLTGFNRSRFGGAPALLRQRPPANVGFSGLTTPGEHYDQFLRAAVETNRQRFLFGETSAFAYGRAGGYVDILAPPETYLADGAPAHNEVVLSFSADSTTVLWLGDPGHHEESWLLEEYSDGLGADVAVLSAGATPSQELVRAVDPSIVIVQGPGDANRTAAAVRGYTTGGVDVYRPVRDGDVTLALADGVRVRAGNRTPT